MIWIILELVLPAVVVLGDSSKSVKMRPNRVNSFGRMSSLQWEHLRPQEQSLLPRANEVVEVTTLTNQVKKSPKQASYYYGFDDYYVDDVYRFDDFYNFDDFALDDYTPFNPTGYAYLQYYTLDTCGGQQTLADGIAVATCFIAYSQDYSVLGSVNVSVTDGSVVVEEFDNLDCANPAFNALTFTLNQCTTLEFGTSFGPSFEVFYSEGTALPVDYNSVIVSEYELSQGCGGSPFLFEAVATGLCYGDSGDTYYSYSTQYFCPNVDGYYVPYLSYDESSSTCAGENDLEPLPVGCIEESYEAAMGGGQDESKGKGKGKVGEKIRTNGKPKATSKPQGPKEALTHKAKPDGKSKGASAKALTHKPKAHFKPKAHSKPKAQTRPKAVTHKSTKPRSNHKNKNLGTKPSPKPGRNGKARPNDGGSKKLRTLRSNSNKKTSYGYYGYYGYGYYGYSYYPYAPPVPSPVPPPEPSPVPPPSSSPLPPPVSTPTDFPAASPTPYPSLTPTQFVPVVDDFFTLDDFFYFDDFTFDDFYTFDDFFYFDDFYTFDDFFNFDDFYTFDDFFYFDDFYIFDDYSYGYGYYYDDFYTDDGFVFPDDFVFDDVPVDDFYQVDDFILDDLSFDDIHYYSYYSYYAYYFDDNYIYADDYYNFYSDDFNIDDNYYYYYSPSVPYAYVEYTCFVNTSEPQPAGFSDCPFYAAANTNSDTQYYTQCPIYSCPGSTLIANGCNPTCAGDQFLELYTGEGALVAANDDGPLDGCGLCSLLFYDTGDLPCQVFDLHEGCYSDSECEGAVIVTGGTVEISYPPSEAPSPAPSFQCAPYSATNTNSDTVNYATCAMYACPGATLQISGCNDACEGDQYIRLLDSAGTDLIAADGGCAGTLCASLTYSTAEACQVYNLLEGCYGDSACSGYYTVRGAEPGPTRSPALAPTAPPSTTSTCGSFSASDTNYDLQDYATCEIYACPGFLITASGCEDCQGDQYFRLFNSDDVQVAYNDDSCGACSVVEFFTTEACQSYSLHEGCYADEACSGSVVVSVSGSSSVPTVAPAECPTFSDLAVTQIETSTLALSFDASGPTDDNSCPVQCGCSILWQQYADVGDSKFVLVSDGVAGYVDPYYQYNVVVGMYYVFCVNIQGLAQACTDLYEVIPLSAISASSSSATGGAATGAGAQGMDQGSLVGLLVGAFVLVACVGAYVHHLATRKVLKVHGLLVDYSPSKLLALLPGSVYVSASPAEPSSAWVHFHSHEAASAALAGSVSGGALVLHDVVARVEWAGSEGWGSTPSRSPKGEAWRYEEAAPSSGVKADPSVFKPLLV